MKRTIAVALIVLSVVIIMVGLIMVANSIINHVQDPSFVTDPTSM